VVPETSFFEIAVNIAVATLLVKRQISSELRRQENTGITDDLNYSKKMGRFVVMRSAKADLSLRPADIGSGRLESKVGNTKPRCPYC